MWLIGISSVNWPSIETNNQGLSRLNYEWGNLIFIFAWYFAIDKSPLPTDTDVYLNNYRWKYSKNFIHVCTIAWLRLWSTYQFWVSHEYLTNVLTESYSPSQPNQTSYRKLYFTEFVQNSLRFNMGIIQYDF